MTQVIDNILWFIFIAGSVVLVPTCLFLLCLKFVDWIYIRFGGPHNW